VQLRGSDGDGCQEHASQEVSTVTRLHPHTLRCAPCGRSRWRTPRSRRARARPPPPAPCSATHVRRMRCNVSTRTRV
jgi:hypothetical protein